MRGRGRSVKKTILVLVFIICALTISLCFGQVIGKYYLTRINHDVVESDPYRLLAHSSGKKKVLRLEKKTYYSILIAQYQQQKTAVLLGERLAEKGWPAVISSTSPYQVYLGFINNKEKLQSLAERIKVEGQETQVITGEINNCSYKFPAEDKFAAQKIAPFLGKIDICLKKAVLLFSDISVQSEEMLKYKTKYANLAEELEKTATTGFKIAEEAKNRKEKDQIKGLAEGCRLGAESMRALSENWQDIKLLDAQQKALALLLNYHQFIG